ncbi:MAG: AAA family ATPase [Candidatus Cryptobacteroides sp.]|nr:AAA family ATPase [Candidatus Cryptobacteroides sp.]
MYKRAQLSVLESRMAESRRTIHVVMGPRQVGKSTMIDQFVEHTSVPYSLFSADGVGKTNTDWISEKWYEVRTKMMLYGENEHILIIDEIQKIAGWSEIVKKEWDQDTRDKRNLKVILLGSSRLLIQKGLEESLEGRYETLKMGYWEWEEMREAFGFTMEQFIYFGGFPGLAPYINDEDRWRRMMEDSIISPILNRDILDIEEIRNPSLLRQVFEIGSMYSAQEISLNKMQGVVNSGTVPTISSYLRILDETMLVKPLYKYDNSTIKTRNSVPKMQAYNNAFRNSYCQHTFEEAVMNKVEWGRQVESAVGAYLAGRSVIDGFQLLFWRDEHKKECDYVLKKGESLIAIEVKSGHADNIEGYLAFKNRFGRNIVNSFIVGPEGLPLEDFFKLNIPSVFRKSLI